MFHECTFPVFVGQNVRLLTGRTVHFRKSRHLQLSCCGFNLFVLTWSFVFFVLARSTDRSILQDYAFSEKCFLASCFERYWSMLVTFRALYPGGVLLHCHKFLSSNI